MTQTHSFILEDTVKSGKLDYHLIRALDQDSPFVPLDFGMQQKQCYPNTLLWWDERRIMLLITWMGAGPGQFALNGRGLKFLNGTYDLCQADAAYVVLAEGPKAERKALIDRDPNVDRSKFKVIDWKASYQMITQLRAGPKTYWRKGLPDTAGDYTVLKRDFSVVLEACDKYNTIHATSYGTEY